MRQRGRDVGVVVGGLVGELLWVVGSGGADWVMLLVVARVLERVP